MARQPPAARPPGRRAPGSRPAASPRAPRTPRTEAGEAVFISFALDGAERSAVEHWIARHRPAGAGRIDVVAAGDRARLGRELAERSPEAMVTPIGTIWPSEVAQGPLRFLHGRLRARVGGPPEVLAAAPATIAELRERYRESGWADEGEDGLVDFVHHQAMLALDRAERRLLGDRYKLPSGIRQEIERSQVFRQGVEDLARRLGRPSAEVTDDALGCLDEMMTQQTRVGVDILGQLKRVLLRTYRIDYDAIELAPLRELNRTRSLVFLPSHRSYMDPLVLSAVLEENGFPPNHVLGGINLDFWPFGPLARRAGIVFIRRSLRDDEIYKFTLRQYLGYLVEKRFNLEWYVEGGCSRSGKLRPPRFGIFAYLVDAFRGGRADDVALVPVSIVYDQLHEAGDMAREATGAAKRAENVQQLIGYIRAQGRRYGSIHVRFGAPMSLKQSLLAAGDRRLEVEKTVIEVLHRVNEATPITPNSLLTLALLGFGDRSLSVEEIRRVLSPLLDYVQKRRLPVTAPGRLRDAEGVLATLEELMTHGVVTRWTGGLEPVYSIGPDQHLVAAYYRNAAIHFMLDRAIAELALARMRDGAAGNPREEVAADARRIRDLFKHEFFFPPSAEHHERLVEELALLGATRTAAAAGALARTPMHLADRVLGSFVEAYWIVADRLAALDAGGRVDEAALVAQCISAGRQYLRQRRIHSPEAVSADLFANALKLARGRGLLEGGGEDVVQGRQELEAELGALAERLAVVRELTLADLDRPAAGRRVAEDPE